MTRLQVFLILGALATGAAAEPEDYSTWAHHGDILLNTGSQGAGIAGDVSHFPLLVRLGKADFPFAEAGGRGQDIRFSSAGGTRLAYQIDRWDSAAGTAEIWVKVDLVRGNSTDQTLQMHWGKASAVDNSDGPGVFQSSTGFVAAWHLGGSGNRSNAVAGGNSAVPVGYQGGESRPGVIGQADSMGWAPGGSYLDIGDGYSGFASGFSYSAWICPTEVGDYTHFIDLGNGTATDNIIMQRHSTTQELAFVNFSGNTQSNEVRVASGIVQKQWQHVAVTVSGREVRMFRNGAQIAATTLSEPINAAWRTRNYLGRSNWVDDTYFIGKMDEPWLSRIARSPLWIRLSYENQKPGQRLVSFRSSPAACQARFAATPFLVVAEGSTATLEGVADCASRIWWSVAGELPFRILDPEVKTLRVDFPRVGKDTTVVFRFSARFGDIVSTKDVPVLIANTVPDPEFTLPDFVNWNGIDPIMVSPVITNLAAIKASAYPEIAYSWSLQLMKVDTALLESAILLESSPSEGILALKLCLDNQGEPACRILGIRINRALGVRPLPSSDAWKRESGRVVWDASGRSGKPEGYPSRFRFFRQSQI